MNPPMNSLPQKATGPYHEPVLLDTLFLRGPDGTTYEIPLTEALRFRVTGLPDRGTGRVQCRGLRI